MNCIRVAFVAFVSAAAMPVAAVDVKVVSAGAVKTAFTEAAAAWERETGNRVVASFAPAGELRKRERGRGGRCLHRAASTSARPSFRERATTWVPR